MNFNFDTATLNPREAQAVIALLSALFPTSGLTQSQPTPQVPTPTTEEQAIFGVPIPPVQNAAVTSAPTTAPVQPATRARRRTKAEMAADALLQQAGHLPATESQNPASTAQELVSEPTSTTKTVSADELRTLLNAYISKHSMEGAIEKLKSFGCNRVTEALALEPTKLNELAEALRG